MEYKQEKDLVFAYAERNDLSSSSWKVLSQIHKRT
jgi:hypothetical protein